GLTGAGSNTTRSRISTHTGPIRNQPRSGPRSGKNASERDVVVGDFLARHVGRGTGRCGARGAGAGTARSVRAGAFVVRRGRLAAAATAAQQDQVVGDDLRGVALIAVLILPTTRLDAAFNVDLLALGQVRGDVLGTPQDDVVPVGLFLPLAGLLVLPAPGRGDGEVGAGNAARGELGFGVFPKMSQQDDFVNATRCHGGL